MQITSDSPSELAVSSTSVWVSTLCFMFVNRSPLTEGKGVLCWLVSQTSDSTSSAKHIRWSQNVFISYQRRSTRCLKMLLHVLNNHLGEGRGALLALLK